MPFQGKKVGHGIHGHWLWGWGTIIRGKTKGPNAALDSRKDTKRVEYKGLHFCTQRLFHCSQCSPLDHLHCHLSSGQAPVYHLWFIYSVGGSLKNWPPVFLPNLLFKYLNPRSSAKGLVGTCTHCQNICVRALGMFRWIWEKRHPMFPIPPADAHITVGGAIVNNLFIVIFI